MQNRFPILALVVALATTGCIHIYEPRPVTRPPAVAKKPTAKPKFKPWKDVLKDTRKYAGFFTFHLKDDGTLYLELRPDQLEKDFGLVMHYSKGSGAFGQFDGLPLSETRLMRFRRVGNRIYLIHRNPRFTARPGSPMRISLEDNVGHSIVAAFKIESIHKETRHVLVNTTPFFVSDYADEARWLRIMYGNRPVRFDKNRSYIAGIQAFPKNVEIDAILTYAASDVPRTDTSGLSDFRSIPIGVRYSLFALPDPPMQPRYGDDRVGHFLDAIYDFSRDQQPSPWIRLVNRWRLEKKDPSQPLSEPVRPIVYYIDRSVPKKYRRYVKEGIEAWNKAFEKAGFKNAIVAREAPDDPNWNAEDIRYSTVRWSAGYRMGYAIGPSQTDPRTGEILNADILISSTFVRAWLYDWQELANPVQFLKQWREAQRLMLKMPPERARRVCRAQLGKAQQLAVQYTLLVALGVIEGGQPMPEEYLGDAIRDLVMHEVGHTLGLRHNFKASSGIPYDRLQDPDFTREHGLTLSVMDYGPVNIALDPKQQGHYWNKEVGTYDIWAIQYAYAPIYEQPPEGPLARTGTPVTSPEKERVGLNKIAAQAAHPLHTYGTDEDACCGGYAVDPLTNTWDLGSDPIRYARDRQRLVARALPQLERRIIAPGEGYQRLRNAVMRLIFERYIALAPVTKFIGGLYMARDHKGDPRGRLPFTPVPAARQREALQTLVEGAFAADSFRFPPDLLNKLAPNRWAHWGMPWFSFPLDFPLHDVVRTIQQFLLVDLLDPARLTRMIDNEQRTPRGTRVFTVADLFATLTEAIWSELGPDGATPQPIDSMRRNLQRMYLDILGRILLNRAPAFPGVPYPEDARSLARMHLTRTRARIQQALEKGRTLDASTLAHLLESQERIDRYLRASLHMTLELTMD